jgi:spermidine synthase
MITELLASRIISKYFGNSLYTWTGIIGIVLGGISLGNYLGGKLADRYNPRKSAPVLLLISSALILLILVIDGIMGGLIYIDDFSLNTSMVILRAVLVITVMFFLPATGLGTISPVMAKYALEQNDSVGVTVGSIYAAGSAGSIVGTFLSGFVLVPLFGVQAVVFMVAAMVALLVFFLRAFRFTAGVWIVMLAIGSFFLLAAPHIPALGIAPKNHKVIYQTDSHYSHIVVKDREGGERVLVMDGLVHNRYDPENPDHLLYEYERIFRSVTTEFSNRFARQKDTLRTVTLGGGAMTFPWYLTRHFPRGSHEVVEIDPEVVRIAHTYFDVPRSDNLRVTVADARPYIQAAEGKRRFNIIYLDAFDSFSVPAHLATRQFAAAMDGTLSENGILLVNIIDIFPIGRFLGAYTKTLQSVFPQVAVYASDDYRQSKRSTFVALALKTPVEDSVLEQIAAPYVRIPEEDILELQQRNRSPLLTDNYAPVENLMAPVFLGSIG